ncbi:hypothetical protein VC81_08945 [Levilactobacillus spicheri]|uniref:Uncharacterized protein n=1 Tax=Levilactobacillus spicheri TaxID=216463 RepID=A0A0F3RRH0_9LACO|nr:hypothetical protein VC81_08945 [Levilactobacillus spicheri]
MTSFRTFFNSPRGTLLVLLLLGLILYFFVRPLVRPFYLKIVKRPWAGMLFYFILLTIIYFIIAPINVTTLGLFIFTNLAVDSWILCRHHF